MGFQVNHERQLNNLSSHCLYLVKCLRTELSRKKEDSGLRINFKEIIVHLQSSSTPNS